MKNNIRLFVTMLIITILALISILLLTTHRPLPPNQPTSTAAAENHSIQPKTETSVPTATTSLPKTPVSSTPSSSAPTVPVYHTWYVAPNGNAINTGTIDQPITLDAVATKAAPGDTVYVRDGTYNLATGLTITRSGNQGAPITFAAFQNEHPILKQSAATPGDEIDAVVIKGSYIIIKGLTIIDKNDPGQAIWIDYPTHDVTLSQNDIAGSAGDGILVSGDHSTLEKNRIHNSGNGSQTHYTHGVYIEGAYNTIRNNIVYNNWANGLQLNNSHPDAHTGHNLIEGNYFYHNGYGTKSQEPDFETSGLVVALGHSFNTIRNNVSCGNASYGMMLLDNQSNNVFTNNLMCYNERGGFRMIDPGKNNSLTHNIFYHDGGAELSTGDGLTSDSNRYEAAAGQPQFYWDSTAYPSLETFINETGQDKNSVVGVAPFRNLPDNGFDPAQAENYNFCNSNNQQWCH